MSVGEIDWILAILVSVTEGIDESDGPGVTLSVGGQIVTGIVIRSGRWFREQENIIREAAAARGGDPGEPGWAMAFQQAAERAEEQLSERKLVEAASENWPQRYKRSIAQEGAVQFIHLKEAQIITGTQFMPSPSGAHWRGRLSAVDGWSFGNVSIS